MKRNHRRSLIVGAALAIGALLAGCVQNGQADQTKPPVQSATVDEVTFAQAVQITSLATMGKQPQGYPSGYEAVFAIYDGLVRLDAEMVAQPDLAESWTTSDDGLTWTFTLRDDVTYQDGSPFTADNVVAYFTKMIDPNYNLSAYSLWSPIESTTKVDDYTVAIKTKLPYSALLNTLAHGSGLIPSAELVEGGEAVATLTAVGTGAYSVETFEPGAKLVLVANPDYFGGEPQYKKINFSYVGDASGRIAGLQSGQVGIVDSVPVEQAAMLEADGSVHLLSAPGLQAFGIGMSQANEFLADPEVRQALNLAIDVEAIVQTVLRGFAVPLTSPLADNTNGHAAVGTLEFNVERAAEMLEDAGFTAGSDGMLSKDGEPFTLRLRTPDGMYINDVLVAQVVQAQLEDLGITVTIDKVDKSTFWDGIKVAKSSVDFDLVLFGFNPSHGAGILQLDIMYRTNPTEDAVSGWNFNWYSNPEVDELLDEARVTVDPDAQQEVMQELQQVIWDDSPYIWLYTPDILVGYSGEVATPFVLPSGFVLPSRAV